MELVSEVLEKSVEAEPVSEEVPETMVIAERVASPVSQTLTKIPMLATPREQGVSLKGRSWVEESLSRKRTVGQIYES